MNRPNRGGPGRAGAMRHGGVQSSEPQRLVHLPPQLNRPKNAKTGNEPAVRPQNAPPRPAWLDLDGYRALLELRKKL